MGSGQTFSGLLCNGKLIKGLYTLGFPGAAYSLLIVFTVFLLCVKHCGGAFKVNESDRIHSQPG